MRASVFTTDGITTDPYCLVRALPLSLMTVWHTLHSPVAAKCLATANVTFGISRAWHSFGTWVLTGQGDGGLIDFVAGGACAS